MKTIDQVTPRSCKPPSAPCLCELIHDFVFNFFFKVFFLYKVVLQWAVENRFSKASIWFIYTSAHKINHREPSVTMIQRNCFHAFLFIYWRILNSLNSDEDENASGKCLQAIITYSGKHRGSFSGKLKS